MDVAGKGITVFCSSSRTAPDPYHQAAVELGKGIAQHGATLIYGGSSVGLMGAAADAALAQGGQVVGIIPRMLMEREQAHHGLTELITVETMHDRKSIMSDRASAYVVLPGGFGTFEECFEVITWKQLGMHYKPILLLNVLNYFQPLLQQIDLAISERMIKLQYRSLFGVAETVSDLFQELERYSPVALEETKWI